MAIGLGMTFVPLTILGVAGVPPEEAGPASGLLNTSRQVGGALGLAVLSTVATSKTDSVLEGLRRVPTPPDILDALIPGYSAALLVGELFAIAGIVVAIAPIRLDTSQLEVASAAPPAA
jgi:hypothetical protein